jgi:hypothetical protein
MCEFQELAQAIGEPRKGCVHLVCLRKIGDEPAQKTSMPSVMLNIDTTKVTQAIADQYKTYYNTSCSPDYAIYYEPDQKACLTWVRTNDLNTFFDDTCVFQVVGTEAVDHKAIRKWADSLPMNLGSIVDG